MTSAREAVCRWLQYRKKEDREEAAKNNPVGVLRRFWHMPACYTHDWSDCNCVRPPRKQREYDQMCDAANRSLETEEDRQRRKERERLDAEWEAETEREQAEWRAMAERRERQLGLFDGE